MSAPTAADVARIAAMGDRVVRNLEITQCYAELSRAVAVRTGSAANWCTFATWASRQAGGTIRGEDLLTRVERRLRRHDGLLAPLRGGKRALLRRGLFAPETTLGRLVAAIHTPFDAFERASDAVARGNLRVFEEIARAFARFLAQVPPDAASESGEFAAFAASLRPGPPPDGQDLLREAFAHYQQQRLEPDPAARAGWLLLANLKIGLHEQTRLQPLIAEAVDAPVVTARDLGRRVLRGVAPRVLGWPAVAGAPLAVAVGVLARPIWTMASIIAREAVTEVMMVLTLPGAVLSLGENVAAPVPVVFAGAHASGARRLRRGPRPMRRGARRLRGARLDPAAAADALHRAPVPGLRRRAVAVRPAVLRQPGRRLPRRTGAGRPPVTRQHRSAPRQFSDGASCCRAFAASFCASSINLYATWYL